MSWMYFLLYQTLFFKSNPVFSGQDMFWSVKLCDAIGRTANMRLLKWLGLGLGNIYLCRLLLWLQHGRKSPRHISHLWDNKVNLDLDLESWEKTDSKCLKLIFSCRQKPSSTMVYCTMEREVSPQHVLLNSPLTQSHSSMNKKYMCKFVTVSDTSVVEGELQIQMGRFISFLQVSDKISLIYVSPF